MKIVIPDDWGDRVRQLDCYEMLKGHEVVILNEPIRDRAALKAVLAGAEALVLIRERTFIDADILDSMPRLKIISQLGLVRRNLSIDECTARGIAVAEGPTLSTGTIELTWGLILASRRCLVREISNFRGGGWQTTFGSLLKGQTLGIWGYGRIGSAIARFGKAFGMRVLVWGREHSVTTARLDGFQIAPNKASLFSDSDILSVHIRLTSETNAIITEADFGLMKPDALFVNTARAELMAPNALMNALKSGRPGSAAVDVYESEPIYHADHPLLSLDNVVCTPHIGYVNRQEYEVLFTSAFKSILSFVAGNPRDISNAKGLRERIDQRS